MVYVSRVGVSAVVAPADKGRGAGFEQFVDVTSIDPGEHDGWVWT